MVRTEYEVVYEQGPTNWGAYVPDLPGCIAVAETREEVERLIGQAIPLHLALLVPEAQPTSSARHRNG